ncbi:hypothetical protein CY652_17935 [Burkholderia sp. WAC0059]|nr:hypothetical protein CY652_17935 [Burkholderia sp. WAC0059]
MTSAASHNLHLESGYASECCVDTTVHRAAGFGYRVTLAQDTHTTHDMPRGGRVDQQASHVAPFDRRSRRVPCRILCFCRVATCPPSARVEPSRVGLVQPILRGRDRAASTGSSLSRETR